jgi:hypothetical protein
MVFGLGASAKALAPSFNSPSTAQNHYPVGFSHAQNKYPHSNAEYPIGYR